MLALSEHNDYARIIRVYFEYNEYLRTALILALQLGY